ncbi:MAG: glutamate formimidoyltransferase [Thermoplasmata archaeon]
MSLVECVPNFSEGRNQDNVNKILNTLKNYPVDIIDVEMNSDHNRSVITLVGDGDVMLDAMFDAIKVASQIIDMDMHKGEHPRFGATDVVPFIPLLDTNMDYCINLARKLGEKVGKELNIPVFLYAEASTKDYRKDLPNIRNEKMQYEQLKEAIKSNENYIPDYGPSELGKAGATIIGAREFLIALNVDLKTDNLKATKDIARRVREKTGGLKNVRALGFNLKETGETQVSMNLINFKETPIPEVYEFVKREAEARGLNVSRTELVGVVPEEALEEIYRFYLRNYDFKVDQILERKMLANFRKDSLRNYLEELSSDKPAPGGGSASGIVGAMGAALVSMVAGLTIGKKGYESKSQDMISIRDEAKNVMWKLYRQAEKDTEAYNNLSNALSMPKNTPEEKEKRTKTIQERLKAATDVPWETANLAASLMDSTLYLVNEGNKNAISDVYCAAMFLKSSVDGSLQNVKINLGLIKDLNFVNDYRKKVQDLVALTDDKVNKINQIMWNDL